MNEIIKNLMSQANLDEATAKKAVEVVKNFLKDKLPDSIENQVCSVLDGLDTNQLASGAENLLDQAKGLFGGK
ncbi:MAG: hypothetical protein Q4A29_04550 [Eubacteriales bacterium]|nr:hypothetical protein [Eubacteriales bacterium]